MTYPRQRPPNPTQTHGHGQTGAGALIPTRWNHHWLWFVTVTQSKFVERGPSVASAKIAGVKEFGLCWLAPFRAIIRTHDRVLVGYRIANW